MKKVLSVIISLITLFVAAAVAMVATAAAYHYTNGDADGDGSVTSLDVTVIQRVILGVSPDEYGDIADRGDVNGDGLSLPDATAVQRYLAQLKDDYHIGEIVEPTGPVAFPTEDNQLPIIK